MDKARTFLRDSTNKKLAEIYDESDAAFIVTAVNAHDDLVAALTDLANWADFHDDTGSEVGKSVITAAWTALKKARGES